MNESEALAKELHDVIEAGNTLAAAAHRVSADYDGVHRLRLALAGWYSALANEWGRASGPISVTPPDQADGDADN